ncbi:MAG: winged helix-turn-helix domain-containing protein [Candidatus Hodarchaeales archaeon]
MSDSNSSFLSYDSVKILDLMSDPIKLAIIFELIRNPDSTSLEIKKKLNIPGSRIYYYLNQLVDNRVIEESDTEEVTKHLSRRKFKISEWFIDVFEELDKEFHKGEYRKAFHLFQIHFAIMVLNQQARLLEKMPESNFAEFMETLNLPYQQFFFATKDTLPIINSNHQEIHTQLHQKSKKYDTMIELIKNSSHVALFGAYALE